MVPICTTISHSHTLVGVFCVDHSLAKAFEGVDSYYPPSSRSYAFVMNSHFDAIHHPLLAPPNNENPIAQVSIFALEPSLEAHEDKMRLWVRYLTGLQLEIRTVCYYTMYYLTAQRKFRRLLHSRRLSLDWVWLERKESIKSKQRKTTTSIGLQNLRCASKKGRTSANVKFIADWEHKLHFGHSKLGISWETHCLEWNSCDC